MSSWHSPLITPMILCNHAIVKGKALDFVALEEAMLSQMLRNFDHYPDCTLEASFVFFWIRDRFGMHRKSNTYRSWLRPAM